MALKSAILSILGHDDLEWIVDELKIPDVDHSSVEAMRAALACSDRVTSDELLSFLSTDRLRELKMLIEEVRQERRMADESRESADTLALYRPSKRDGKRSKRPQS
jgi:hypothetical protein